MNSLAQSDVLHSEHERWSRQHNGNHVRSLTLGPLAASDCQRITAALGFGNFCHFVGAVAVNLDGGRRPGDINR